MSRCQWAPGEGIGTSHRTSRAVEYALVRSTCRSVAHACIARGDQYDIASRRAAVELVLPATDYA